MRFTKLTTIAIILLFANALLAQTTIKARILDFDTHKPIPNCEVTIYSHTNGFDTTLYTCCDGKIEFSIENDYYINISKTEYRFYNKFISEDSIHSDTVFYIYSIYSESYKFDNIAARDGFDFTLGFDVFSPQLQDSESKFKSVFSFYYAYDIRTKLANNLQLGFNYMPIKIKWMNMNTDSSIIKDIPIKERYFEASTSLGVYFRYIFTVHGKNDNRGLFLDLGAEYTLPYYYSYTYFTDNHIKTSQNKIHNFKDFSAMARIGFSAGSIKATYRFADIMKDDFIQPPKFTLGVELNISMN